jgi:hypothetical protein
MHSAAWLRALAFYVGDNRDNPRRSGIEINIFDLAATPSPPL